MPERIEQWLKVEVTTPRWVVIVCIECAIVAGAVIGQLAEVAVRN